LIFIKYSLTTIDFPTPVSPINNTLNPPDINLSTRNPNLTVSAVGTKILKKGVFGLKTNSGITSFQD
jgi:hypothetical protein